MPRISVIMPVFNGSRTIERALASLTGLGADALEVIAVDQASTDGSREILEGFRGRLNLRIIDAPTSRSWVTNTNIGLGAAQTDLVTMLHQDDLWLPGRVDAILDLAARFPQASLYIHAARLIDDDDRPVGTIAPPFGPARRLVESGEALRMLLVQNTVPLPGAVFDREIALSAGGLRETLWYTADWDLWLKLASRGPVAWSPERLVAFRIHAGSQTVRRSADLNDFETQLAAPVEAHIGAVLPHEAHRILRHARASNLLNLYLAGRYHGHKVSAWPFLRTFMSLGPTGWPTFLRRTQILRRLVPRVRLLFR